MKTFLLQAILFMCCQPALHSMGNTPEYIAVVQERLPGNIIADDEPNAHQGHFTRAVYVLMDNNQSLVIDSIMYGSETLYYETEKLAANKQQTIGIRMVNNKPVTLTESTGKTWWKISLKEGNDSFDQMPALLKPILIYTSNSDKKETWKIEKETTIAPVEHY